MIIKTRCMQKSCIWACECKKTYEIDKYLNNFTFIYCRYFCNNMWRWNIHFFIALVTNHHCLSELFYDQINVLEWKVMKLWIKLMIQVNLSFQLNVKVINYFHIDRIIIFYYLLRTINFLWTIVVATTFCYVKRLFKNKNTFPY